MFHTIKKNSLMAGFISGITLTALTVGIITFNSASTSALTSSSSASCTTQPTLKQGSRGACVTKAQRLLSDRGISAGKIDGVFGPITKAAVMQLQRQNRIGVDGIVGPKTWAALNDTARSITASVPSKCLTNSKTICIVKGSGSQASLYAVQNKQVVKSFPVRTGDGRGADYATSIGSFSVGRRYVDYTSKEYDAPMPYSLFFNGGQAVHYSSSFASTGYAGGAASHGCVNVGYLNDAKELYNWAPAGTRVIVTR